MAYLMAWGNCLNYSTTYLCKFWIFVRKQSRLSPKPARKGGDVPRSHGYSNGRPVKGTGDDFLQRDRSVRDPLSKVGFILSTKEVNKTNFLHEINFRDFHPSPQASKSNNDSPAQGRIMGRNTMDAQKRGSYHECQPNEEIFWVFFFSPKKYLPEII